MAHASGETEKRWTTTETVENGIVLTRHRAGLLRVRDHVHESVQIVHLHERARGAPPGCRAALSALTRNGKQEVEKHGGRMAEEVTSQKHGWIQGAPAVYVRGGCGVQCGQSKARAVACKEAVWVGVAG